MAGLPLHPTLLPTRPPLTVSRMSELDRLRARVAELEDALGLTAEIPRSLLDPLRYVGTSHPWRKAIETIGVLLARPFVSRDVLFTVLYGERPECDQPGVKAVDMALTYARKSLATYGIKVVNVFGEGWYISDPDKAKLRAVIDGLNERAV
jgi:hypothetical protein